MTGYRNIFGEERVTTPLFQSGSLTDAIMADWFFGELPVGAPVEMAGMLEAMSAAGASGILAARGLAAAFIAESAFVALTAGVGRGLAGTAGGQSSLAGPIGLGKGLTGAAAGIGALGAAGVTAARGLVGSIEGHPDLVGNLMTALGLSGAVQGVSDLSGQIGKVCVLAGSMDALSELRALLWALTPYLPVEGSLAISPITGALAAMRLVQGKMSGPGMIAGDATAAAVQGVRHDPVPVSGTVP